MGEGITQASSDDILHGWFMGCEFPEPKHGVSHAEGTVQSQKLTLCPLVPNDACRRNSQSLRIHKAYGY